MLREGIRNLPTWWIVLSAAVFIAGFGYLALYPGFGAFKGLLGWTSHDELARAQTKNDQLEASLHNRVRGKTVEVLATDPEVLRVGEALFVDNCAACHGRNARGNLAVGAPDLTDAEWLYGGDGQAILTSIKEGRRGAMPAFAGKLPDPSIVNLGHYVASLSGYPHDSLKAFQGRQLFVNCMIAVAFGVRRAAGFAPGGSGRRIAGAVLIASAALTLFAPHIVAAAPWLHPWMPYLCRVDTV